MLHVTYRLGLERVPAQKGEELCGFIVDLVLFPPAKTEPKSNENPCQFTLLAGVNFTSE